jgi:hypothetical protein
MSIYTYALLAITTNVALGNEIAAALDPDDGSGTFGGSLNQSCRAAGSAGPATAWPARSPMTAARYAIASEFIAGGYPAALLAAGFTTARLDEIREAFRNPVSGELMLVAGPRSEYENGLPAFIASHGYEIVPRS